MPSVGRDTVVAPGAAARIAAAAQGTAHAPPPDPPAPGAHGHVGVRGQGPPRPARSPRSSASPPAAAPCAAPKRAGTTARRQHHDRLVLPRPSPTKRPAWPKPEPLPAGTLAYIAQATATRPARVRRGIRGRRRRRGHRRRTRHPPGSPVLITRTQHYDADGKLLQYAETIIPAGTWRARDYVLTRN